MSEQRSALEELENFDLLLLKGELVGAKAVTSFFCNLIFEIREEVKDLPRSKKKIEETVALIEASAKQENGIAKIELLKKKLATLLNKPKKTPRMYRIFATQVAGELGISKTSKRRKRKKR